MDFVMNDKIIKVLWTGGWDSTFRVVELSRMNVTVQPVYVIDPNRKSRQYELTAMKNILSLLKQKEETKATLLPVMIYKLDEIPKDDKISDAYKIIAKETSLGSQLEWLAWLGKLHPGMEMCVEAGTGHTTSALKKFCKLDFQKGIGIVNEKESTYEGNLVLGWFKYPIKEKTEVQMHQLIKEWGYSDVMKLIWFCHKPINGAACGLCHPCCVKIYSGMEWLLPKTSRTRHKAYKNIDSFLGHRCARLFEKVCRYVYKNQ